MLMTTSFDCSNASITYEQQQAVSGFRFGRFLDRMLDRGLLSEAVLRQRLNELQRLPSGWDGEDASRLSERTVSNARNIALLLLNHTKLPEVIPNPGDTLTFEWEAADGVALMEIGHNTYSFLMKTHAGRRTTDTGQLDQEAEIVALGRLVQRTLFDGSVA
jgi:hypothetical protein